MPPALEAARQRAPSADLVLRNADLFELRAAGEAEPEEAIVDLRVSSHLPWARPFQVTRSANVAVWIPEVGRPI